MPNYIISKYMRPKLVELKRETEKSTSIGRDFKTSLTVLICQAGRKLVITHKTWAALSINLIQPIYTEYYI